MEIPAVLNTLFPPSPTRLLTVVREQIDDSMLWEIATADYGTKAEKAFTQLRVIRDQGFIPEPLEFITVEVLELTRWHEPSHPNFSNPPRSVGKEGHLIRLFACAARMRISTLPHSHYFDASEEATMVTCSISAGALGEDFNLALGCFFTWYLQWRTCFPDEFFDLRIYLLIILLTLCLRLSLERVSEAVLGEIAKFILDLEHGFPSPFDELPPALFGKQIGRWQVIADEIEQHALRIIDPVARENILLCKTFLEF